ncbi:hypothetical protein ACFVZJ_21200 [Streptomyces sp. NPDC058322]|uniref:hypothetical protein n=1 Tax=Streptomyces sp. NPDC058322 TaxID=3346446 RepID=UPI0036E8EE29
MTAAVRKGGAATRPNRPTRGQVSPLAPHGTTARATGRPAQNIRGCSCQPCLDAKNRALKIRTLRTISGQPVRVPTEPVAQHIRSLFEAGTSWPQLTEAANCSTSTIYRILGGQPLTRRSVAERILAVRPAIEPRASTGTVGARRRLQALMAIGHTVTGIAADSDVDSTVINAILNGRKASARYETVERIKRTYDRLSTRPNEDARPAAVTASRNRAARQGWRDPLWWEDMGHIDDPDFDPAAAETANRSELATLRREEVEHLRSFGCSAEEIAKRVDLNLSTVRQILLELRTGQRRDRTKAAA